MSHQALPGLLNGLSYTPVGEMTPKREIVLARISQVITAKWTELSPKNQPDGNFGQLI